MQITFSIDTPQDLANAIKTLKTLHDGGTAAKPAETVEAPAAPRRGRPPKNAEKAKVSDPAERKASQAKTVEDKRNVVRQALRDYAATNTKEAAIAILRDVGNVSQVADLAPSQFDDIIAALKNADDGNGDGDSDDDDDDFNGDDL